MSSTPYKPSDFYKPQRRWKGLVSALLCILAALIVLALVLFFALGKYVVVTPERLYLALPGSDYEDLTTAEETPVYTPSVTAEIVVDQTDFSSISAVAGEDLSAVNAVYLKAEDVTEANLTALTGKVSEHEANAVMLQLKASDGQLMWASTVSMAVSYGATGTLDLTSYISSWKESGLYLIAQLSCCTDELMATRYPALALKNADGTAYHDDYGYWLDPYNRTVREYIVDLAKELSEMGFDEIVFSELRHPAAEGLTYTQAMTASPDPKSAVDSFSLRLHRAFEGSDTRLSVRCDAASVRTDLSAQTGEDLDFYLKVFDRLYCNTTAADAASDQALAVEHISGENRSHRFVAVASETAGIDSWVLTD